MAQKQTKETPASSDPNESAARIGVYICHCGGNISDVVEVEKVVAVAARLPNVVVARNHLAMCSDPGQNLIAEDIIQQNLNRVVVAACSPSLHELTFRHTLLRSNLNPYQFEHANLREQVSWCSKSDPEGATDKAIRLVAAAVAKVKLQQPLAPIKVQAHRQVVVIGGGVSGLRCARDLSGSGLKVILLEQTPFLGGRMAQLNHIYPTDDKARDLIQKLITETAEDPNITIHTLAEVTGASGYVGNYNLSVRLHPRGLTEPLNPEQMRAAVNACPELVDNEFNYQLNQRKAIYLSYEGCYPAIPAIDWNACTRCGKCREALDGKVINLDQDAEDIELDAGALVLATGFDLYEPRLGEYGYGEHDEVITLAQLIRLMDEEGPTGGRLMRNGRPINNICMIHCVGSRQKEGIHEPAADGNVNDYCSRVCCTATLQAANEIREKFPEANVFDFHQDIRTYGRGHEDYYENASKQSVMFFRFLAEEAPVVQKAETHDKSPLLVKVKDTLTFGEELEVPADLVVLATGMVPRNINNLVKMLKLPRSADRFLQEVHPKLRPVEMAINGILLAGTCQGPMDITESCAAAASAAAKASALLSKGYIELDPFIANVNRVLCTGGIDCEKECIQECKFKEAVSLIEVQVDGQTLPKANIEEALCAGCGMCAAACPKGAIQVEGRYMDQFDAMVDAIVADY